MKIQSIIRRAKGTTVELGGQVYFFSPDSDHTCEVTDEAHIDRFLSIKEGFREIKVVTEDKGGAKKLAEADDTNGGDNSKASDAVDLEALVAAYVAKFGKKPHHNMKAEAIAKKLAEAEKQEG